MTTIVAPNGQPFTIVPRLTRIVLAFQQPGLIADLVLPRIPVGAELFEYTKVSVRETISIPNTEISRTGAANQVEFSRYNEQARTKDYGLESPVPAKDVQTAAAAGVADPLEFAAVQTMELMVLAREKRVANLVTTPDNYAAGLKTTLDGTAGKKYFDDETNGEPISQMQDAMDKMMVRPNTLVMDRPTYTAVKRHPETVAKAFGPTGKSGQVSLQQLQEVLEVERILIGDGWTDTAKKGQIEVPARIWPNAIAMLHINQNLTGPQTALPTFGFTAQFEGLQGGTYFDPKRGVKGCQVAKVIDQVLELISWQSAGYLFTNPRKP